MVLRYLVAYDFSLSADAALELALHELHERGGGELLLVHAYAVPDVPYPTLWPVAGTGVPSSRDLESTLTLEVAGAVEKVAAKARQRADDVAVEVLLRRGPPADEILAAARENAVDRVVMGTHGRTGLAHVLLGSVAERVLRAAPVPVLVVKAPDAGAGRGAERGG